MARFPLEMLQMVVKNVLEEEFLNHTASTVLNTVLILECIDMDKAERKEKIVMEEPGRESGVALGNTLVVDVVVIAD